MIKGGYILQPRTVDDSEVSEFPPVTRELWHYLLRKVNHTRNDRLNINRGQGFFKLAEIQEDLKWYSGYRKNIYSKPQLTKSLRRLRESSMVATAKETRGLLITICNYDYYQYPGNYEGNDEGSAKETRRKQKGRTINKNEKNVKNEKKDNPPRFNARLFLSERGVKKKNIDGWFANRSKKRLANTENAMDRLEREVKKTNLSLDEALKVASEKGWGGFDACWLDGHKGSSDKKQIEKEMKALGANA
jgi:hypothetical protein